MSDKVCKNCKRKGFPIYPVRYAVAPDRQSAQEISGSFKNKSGLELDDIAIYTLRKLRDGYLYVYDKGHGLWTGYERLNEVFFMFLPETSPNFNNFTDIVNERNSIGEKDDIKACNNYGQSCNMAVITLPTDNVADIFWFAFSDVRWTANVLKKHSQAIDSENGLQDDSGLDFLEHMTSFSLKSWITGVKEKKFENDDGQIIQMTDWRVMDKPQAHVDRGASVI